MDPYQLFLAHEPNQVFERLYPLFADLNGTIMRNKQAKESDFENCLP